MGWIPCCMGRRPKEFTGFDRYIAILPFNPCHSFQSSDNCLLIRPTLVFVTGGSNPQANEAMINYSMDSGITAVVLSTTAELKNWVGSNEGIFSRLVIC